MSKIVIKRCQWQRHHLFLDYKIINLHWHQTPPLMASFVQRQWLNRNDSLTFHLSQFGHIEIKIIKEKVGLCSRDEAAVLQCPATMVWFREIIILLNTIPVIAARSITPLSASRNVWASVRQLGKQSLAYLLYQDKRIQRSPFAFQLYAWQGSTTNTNFEKKIQYCALKNGWTVNKENKNSDNLIISRRSIFLKNNEPLIVTETFLPTLWNNFVL